MNIMRRKDRDSKYMENLQFSFREWGPEDEEAEIFIDWAEISTHTNRPYEFDWTEVEWGKVIVVQNDTAHIATLTSEQEKLIEERILNFAAD